jgi:hypothetical protein
LRTRGRIVCGWLEPVVLPRRLRQAHPQLSPGIAMSADPINALVSWVPILVFVGIAIWYARSAGLRAVGRDDAGAL